MIPVLLGQEDGAHILTSHVALTQMSSFSPLPPHTNEVEPISARSCCNLNYGKYFSLTLPLQNI
jgi:hypothetical protein